MNTNIEKILQNYFDFDVIFNLLDYDYRMLDLYNEIKLLKKISYNSNYRFIFLHYDTEYYITNDEPGLTLRNLQRLLVSLDIPNYFCLILTQQNLDNQLETLRMQETNDSCRISHIANGLQPLIHFNINDVKNNVELISRKFICLNGVKRFHRAMLYSMLVSKNLLNEGIISYGAFGDPKPKKATLRSKSSNGACPPSLRFLYATDSSRINDIWVVKDPEVLESLKNINCVDEFKNFHDTYGRYRDLAVKLSQQAFLYVITESTFHYPTYVMGEKTFKPIIAKRPFVLMSSYGSLQILKDFGFKTFDKWWDESYDTIKDPTQRCKKITSIIEYISNQSITDLQHMYADMQEIIDFNFNYYKNEFCNNEINKLKKACFSNLMNRQK